MDEEQSKPVGKLIESDSQKNKEHRYLHYVVVLLIASTVLSVLMNSRWNNSALLYIGIPSMLAVLLAYFVKPKSIVGASMLGMTLLLLMSMIVLREGAICVVMAAPIFYIITGTISGLIQALVYKKRRHGRIKASALITLVAIMSLEGTHPDLTVPRNAEVKVEQIVAVNDSQFADALAGPMPFTAPIPFLTGIFPKPVSSVGEGLLVGDQRQIDFVYYKHIWFNAHRGNTIFRVISSDANSVTFDVPHDSSYIGQYLRWQQIKVNWQQIDQNNTMVTWSINYERALDPAWYFAPMQHYYVSATANYLIQNLASAAKEARQ